MTHKSDYESVVLKYAEWQTELLNVAFGHPSTYRVPPETDPRELRISLVGDGLDLGDGEPGSLAKVIASLEAARDRAPPEYRDAVRCCIEYEGDYDGGGDVSSDVWYTRMETPEEVTARIAKRKACAEHYRKDREDEERRELAKLQAKYGHEER